MNSRERFLAAVGHRQPDRAPIGVEFSGQMDRKLREQLGLDEAGFREWVGKDLARIMPRFKNPASAIRYSDPTIEVTPDGLLLDVWRVPYRQVRAGAESYVDLAGRPPLAKARSVEELDAFPWPAVDDWDYSQIPADLDAAADKATWGHSRGFFEIAHFMRGMEPFLEDLALDPDFACSLMDHVAGSLMARARGVLEAGCGRLTFFEYNDDVGSQRGLLISPAMWRRHIRPRMAAFCRLIHEHGAFVRYHCCGSCRPIIPDLIEIGVDILNPVQPLADGMDPFELNAAFGDRLAFHGGIDVQHLLPHGSPVEVRRQVRRMIDEVGRNGGYILGGSHVVQADVPVENVVAMLEEAKISRPLYY